MTRSPFVVLTFLVLAAFCGTTTFACKEAGDNEADSDDDDASSNPEDESTHDDATSTSTSTSTSSTASDSLDSTMSTGENSDSPGESSTSESGSDQSQSEDDSTTNNDSSQTTSATGQDDAAACEVFAGMVVEDLPAATKEDEATQVVVKPDPNKAYRIILEEGKAGYITYEIGEWNTTQAFYVSKDVDYTVKVAGGDTQMDRTPVAMCAEQAITEQLIHFAHWTPATLTFSETGPREVWLMVYKAQP